MRQFLPSPLCRKSALLLSLSTLALAGCGGGDGSSDLSAYLSPFAPPAPVAIAVLTGGITLPPTIVADTAALLAQPKYQNTNVGITWLQTYFDANVPNGATQDPIRTSGAAFAHAAGITGAGELIAISDKHVSSSHESISGRITVESNGSPLNPDGSPAEHGTSVASVAAGNSANFVGTAPGASIMFGTYETDAALANLGFLAASRGAVAWNNSWGFPNLAVNQSNFNLIFNFDASSLNYLNALDTYAAQGVVVFAVDNETRQNATLMDGLPYLRPSLEAGWIAAANGVPTMSGNTVTDVHLLSNACWEAARWCLVADGTWNAATGGGSAYAATTGSSFAAPQISGALALLAQAFPSLTPHQLRVRLLASAEDDFFTPDDTVQLATGFNKGYSVIYGMGFLDIEAALRPIGATSLSLSEGSTVSTEAPVLLTGTAMGDALETGLAGTNIAVRDALAASFSMPASALTAGTRAAPQADRMLAKSLRSNLAAERQADPAALNEPFAAFSGPVLAMTANEGRTSAAVLLPEGGTGSSGLTISQALTDGPTRVDLGLKVTRDDGQLTSLDASNAAMMASVALGLTQDLGNGAYLALSGEIGVTDLGGSTVFGSTGSAGFNAVKLTAGKSDLFSKGDRLSVGIGLPVAIASGETVLELPVLRQGAAAFDQVALDLAPEERQVDLDLTYQAQLGDGLEMKLSLVQSENYGNRAGVSDTSGALAIAFRF